MIGRWVFRCKVFMVGDVGILVICSLDVIMCDCDGYCCVVMMGDWVSNEDL